MNEEKLLLNKEPLNQQAKELLQEAGQTPDPNSLYSLQLASWALESGKITEPQPVQDQLNLLFGWSPAEAMRFLTVIPGAKKGEEQEYLLKKGEKLSPVELAERITGKILSNLESLYKIPA